MAIPLGKLALNQEACAYLHVLRIAAAKLAFMEFDFLGVDFAGVADWLNFDAHRFNSVSAAEALSLQVV